jgi:hypothetical protein
MTELRTKITALREALDKQSPMALAETMRREMPGVLGALEALLDSAEFYSTVKYDDEGDEANEALRRCEELMGVKR